MIYFIVCDIVVFWLCFVFFKQKTAYEMRISDWSSDVCSSDLALRRLPGGDAGARDPHAGGLRGVALPPPSQLSPSASSRGPRASDGAVALDTRVKPE